MQTTQNSLQVKVESGEPFKKFLIEHSVDVVKWANWVSGRFGLHNRKDIAQQTYIRALEAYATYKSEYKVSVWIFQIAKNICLQQIEREAMRERHLATLHNPDYGIVDHPAIDLENRELVVKIRQIMSELSERDRNIILWRIEGCTYDVIVTRLGGVITLGRVQQIYTQFCATTKRQLESV